MVKHKILDWRPWLYGLFTAVIGGGSSAVTACISVNIIDPKQFNYSTGAFWQLAFTLFVINGGFSMFVYLKQSPLPKVIEVDDDPPAGPSAVKLSPPPDPPR